MNNRRLGFTLVEMLCVMALLLLIATILTLLLRGTLEIERFQAEGFDRLLQTTALADQFRADVARAETAPLEWRDHQADEHTLILQMKNDQHVIYRWQQGTLERQSYETQQSSERTLPLDNRSVGVEFVRADKVALIRLRLSTLRKGVPQPGQTLEIAAALGGDWR